MVAKIAPTMPAIAAGTPIDSAIMSDDLKPSDCLVDVDSSVTAGVFFETKANRVAVGSQAEVMSSLVELPTHISVVDL